MTTNIPRARQLLTDVLTSKPPLAEPLPAWAEDHIKAALKHMTRKQNKRRAPRKSKPITPDMVAGIRKYAEMYPYLTQQEIGVIFGVSAGRVSEAINFLR